MLRKKRLTREQLEEYIAQQKVTPDTIERLKKVLNKKELPEEEKQERSEKKRFLKKAISVGFTQEQAEFLWSVFNTKADKDHRHNEIVYAKL